MPPTDHFDGVILFESFDFLGAVISKVEESQGGDQSAIEPTHIGLWSEPDDTIWESTIYTTSVGKRQDGPQINSLTERISAYDAGGRIWRLHFTTDLSVNWFRSIAFAQARVGKNHYNIGELPADLAAALHLTFLAKLAQSPSAEVCSEFVLETLAAGGLHGPIPYGSNPEMVVRQGWFSSIEQLKGASANLRGYNYNPIPAQTPTKGTTNV